jgi:hypothetical protein
MFTGTIECDEGYAGTVQKMCEWEEVNCTSLGVLVGCQKEVSCKPLEIVGMPDICTQNPATECENVPAGGSCQVFCKLPFDGPPSTYTCPEGNIDPTQGLIGEPAVCDCPDPTIIPPGYNKTSEGWTCGAGYLGTAEKLCSPSNACVPNPTLRGCTAPVVCAAAAFEDEDTRNGFIKGHISFGPLLVDNKIDDSAVISYNVYWADECERTTELIKSLKKEDIAHWLISDDELSGAGGAGTYLCCRDDVYAVKIPVTNLKLEPEKQNVLVIAETEVGFAQVGRSIKMTDKYDPNMGLKTSAAAGAHLVRQFILALVMAALLLNAN